MPLLSEDEEAHRSEHALEVQLPFLQVLAPGFQFVPITVGTSNFEVLSALGVVIGSVLAKQDEPRAGHRLQRHESLRERQRHSRQRPSRDRSVAGARSSRTVRRRARGQISMCGYGPAVVMLTAARKLGATQAELIRYATSGDVSGDQDMVVGYAGIAVY